MAKFLTVIELIMFELLITGAVVAQSVSACPLRSTCLKTSDCFRLLRKQNIPTDGVFYSCSDGRGRMCCPVGLTAVPDTIQASMEAPSLGVTQESDRSSQAAQESNLSAQPAQESDPMRLLPTENCGFTVESRIIGGQAAFIGQYPWMALLAYRISNHTNTSTDAVEYQCGGTLISNRYVLTAAHCVNKTLPVHVRLGELDLGQDPDCDEWQEVCADPPLDVPLEEVVPHPRWNQPLLKNDIALIRLARKVTRTEFIAPICLPFGLNVTGEESGKRFKVAGWGKVKSQDPSRSKTLLHTTVVNVPVSLCNKQQPRDVRPIGDLQLCAGNRGINDVCKGDSGGPLMDIKVDGRQTHRTYQVGIVSFGFGFCGGDIPSVYTRLTAYLPWILDQLRP